MSYRVSWTRDGRTVSEIGSRAQVAALADYLRRTFGIVARVGLA